MGKRGIFITLEGGEGTGKSTQMTRLAEFLRAQGHEVVTTREPGGTEEAEKIRTLLVHREGGNWTPMAECLLLFAGRQMHVEHLIKPALERGAIVISDRFADSTRAYQGYGHNMDRDRIEAINNLVLGDFAPDVTFILDLPVETGLKRSGRRLSVEDSQEDRFENLDIGFHERMRQGYLDIAARETGRCVVIDATGTMDDIAAALQTETQKRLK